MTKKFLNMLAVLFFAQFITTSNAFAEKYFTINDGELDRPTGYREWVFVGTPVFI